MPVKFENEESLLDAIKDVRNDATETNWVLAGHVDNNPELIRLAGTGNGGLDEMLGCFDDNAVMYGLLRVTQKIDLSVTVKFVYIYYIGESVPALQRGKIGTAQYEVNKIFSPFHSDFSITRPEEISMELINNQIDAASGKINFVRDVNHEDSKHERGFTATSLKSQEKKESKFGFQGTSQEAKGGASVPIDSAVIAAIADVRSDKTETNWALAAYEDNNLKKPVILIGSGAGGADDLTALLTTSMIAYGIVRIIDVIEGISTVKFAFLNYIGPEVSIMNKAKATTNKGSVNSSFAPYHVTLDFSSTHEVSDEILLHLVQDASGSKSKVKH